MGRKEGHYGHGKSLSVSTVFKPEAGSQYRLRLPRECFFSSVFFSAWRKCAVAKKPFLKYRVLEVLSALCYFNGPFPVAEKNMA